MRYPLFAIFFLLLMFAASTVPSNAQFDKGQNYVGGRIGIGYYGSAFSFGADYEYGFADVGEYGPGRIGIGGTIDYWGWSDGSGDNYWSYSWVPIGVMAYYHLNLDNRKLDPFGGVGLGYEVVTATWHSSYSSLYNGSAGYSSGIYITGQVGVRYFFSPNLAAQARLGFGASLLSVGLDYKF
jgi:hypothetical protein